YAHEFDEGLAAKVIRLGKTVFENLKDLQEESEHGLYALFADQEEWELAEWLIRNVHQ
ncbi:hypothetical protein J3R82DRAFT_9416, partial [Butyriboletus roseoflavus]